MVRGKIYYEEDDDGDDDLDAKLMPMADYSWMRRILLKWNEFVDVTNVDLDYLYCANPEHVLKSNNYKLLKDVITTYKRKRCPRTTDDANYCDVMVTAAYVRRMELRFASRLRCQGID